MKKIITFAAVVAFGATLALSSCSKKKDWTCKCTWSMGGTSTSQDIIIQDKSKKDAKSACEGQTFAGATSLKCEIQ